MVGGPTYRIVWVVKKCMTHDIRTSEVVACSSICQGSAVSPFAGQNIGIFNSGLRRQVGSHGLQAHAYPELFEMITAGKLDPSRLLDHTISLAEAPTALAALGGYDGAGVTVIDLSR